MQEQRKHALLSASGSSRWLNCTPSARLEEGFKDETSDFAREGTLAHEFAEFALRLANGEIDKRAYTKAVKKLEQHELYDPEMDDEVEKYTNFVLEEYTAATVADKNALLSVEEVVNLTEFIEEGFGTCDAVIIADGTIHVIDLKYGKGVKVDAVNNSQLMLYALGALVHYDMFYNIDKVKCTIVQPRLDHISTFEIEASKLKTWGDDFVKPRAILAYEGKGEQEAGSWCRWCKAAPKCKTLRDVNLKAARVEFDEPKLLSDEELVDLFLKSSEIANWLNTVSAYMLNEAKAGKIFEGLKLVEGRSQHKFSDPDQVIEVLRSLDFEDSQIINVKPKGLTDLTKLLGKDKFNSLLDPYIIKPAGAPTLVDINDKRPALGIEQAKQDFKN